MALGNVSRFTTGSKFVMHSLLETGTFEFIHKDNIQGRHLVADNPVRSLIFPVNERCVSSSETFIKNITEDMSVLVRFDTTNIKDFT